MLYLNEFLEREREIILRYTYYLIPTPKGPVWLAMETFLREYYPSPSPPYSSKQKESIILFMDKTESIAIIDSLMKQDPALETLCPHRRYKEGAGSVFVLQHGSWESLGALLDFLAGVTALYPEVYACVTPLVLQHGGERLCFNSAQATRVER